MGDTYPFQPKNIQIYTIFFEPIQIPTLSVFINWLYPIYINIIWNRSIAKWHHRRNSDAFYYNFFFTPTVRQKKCWSEASKWSKCKKRHRQTTPTSYNGPRAKVKGGKNEKIAAKVRIHCCSPRTVWAISQNRYNVGRVKVKSVSRIIGEIPEIDGRWKSWDFCEKVILRRFSFERNGWGFCLNILSCLIIDL